MYINALTLRCTLMILHLSRMRRKVNRNVCNAEKCKRYTATGFSAMLLAFISTERLVLVAVRRPLAFSSCSERAEKAVINIAVFDCVIARVFNVARHTCCPRFGRILVMSLLSDRPLFTYFHVLPSRRRYRCIQCKTTSYSRRFVLEC